MRPVKAGRCPMLNSRARPCSPGVTSVQGSDRLTDRWWAELGHRGGEREFHRAPASVEDVETVEER